MYFNPALDAVLAQERKSQRRAVFAREHRSRPRHPKSSILTTLLGLLLG